MEKEAIAVTGVAEDVLSQYLPNDSIKLVTLAPCTPTPLTTGVQGAITAGAGVGLAVKVVVMPSCCKTCVMHACNTCYMSTRQDAMCTLHVPKQHKTSCLLPYNICFMQGK